MLSGILLLLGPALLVASVRWLVAAASVLARSPGLPDLAISVTIAAFGTSSPGFVIDFPTDARRQTGIAVGSVPGNNTFNTRMIPGAATTIQAPSVERDRLEVDPIWLSCCGHGQRPGQRYVDASGVPLGPDPVRRIGAAGSGEELLSRYRLRPALNSEGIS